MKFTNGMWKTKLGYEIQAPAEVYDFEIGTDSVTVYGPYKRIQSRGDTLNTGMLTVTIRAPRRDMIAVKLENFMGERRRGPDFELCEEAFTPEITQEGDVCILKSGGLSAEIRIRGEWGIRYLYDGKELTSSGPKSMAHILDDHGTAYMRE